MVGCDESGHPSQQCPPRRMVHKFVVVFVIVVVVGLSSAYVPRSAVQAASAARPFPSVPFVVGCGVSHESNDDPIIHPGHSGMSHRHVFFGNRSTNASSTVASLNAAATTCEDPADRASYWLPGLIGGSWINMRAYYSSGLLTASSVRPMPLGLQIVTGWKFDAVGQGSSVSWSCGLLADQVGWTASRPATCRTGTKLSARIDFPQCWDGRHLAAPGNVVWASGRACPAGHPIGLPQLRIRVDVVGQPTQLASGRFETMHADFWNIWEPNRLSDLVTKCIRGERAVQREVRRCGVPGAGPRKG